MILISRMSPIVPHSLVSYAAGLHSNFVLEVHPRILCRISPPKRSLYLRRSHGRQGSACKRRCSAARPCHMDVLLPRPCCDARGHRAYNEDCPAEFEDILRRTRTGRRTDARVGRSRRASRSKGAARIPCQAIPLSGLRSDMEIQHPALNRMQRVSLFDAMLARRSRRFAQGMNLPTGPLAFRSQRAPKPLREEEEAALAFAACGVTGYALAELPYGPSVTPESSGGNIMTHFIARTIASGDAMHDCAVFVINDAGTWMLKRPQDYPRQEIPELIRHAHEKRLIGPLSEGSRGDCRPPSKRPAPGAICGPVQQVDDQRARNDLLPPGSGVDRALHQRDALDLRR